MEYGRTLLSICILAIAALATTDSLRADESLDSQSRPRVAVLELTGDLRAPDPALFHDERSGNWYVFSTGDPLVAGGTIQIRRSADLRTWTYAGNVFNSIPAWVTQAVPGVMNLWAPEIHVHDGTIYLYYAASTFGSNRSVIGLATTRTLEPSEWVDQGIVAESQVTDDFNAIDPAVIEGKDGTPYLAFGSFWSGIRMWTLQWPSGRLAPGQGAPLRLADRFVPPNAIEGAQLTYHDGWFYLFVSFDFCCQGTNSTYKIAVGRSRSPTGPFFDKLGTPLEHGGGTVILSEQGTQFGPGGASVYGGFLAHHYYDGTANGDIRLGIRRIAWSEDNWPIIANPIPGL
jgi:arabinan endo-1,5-alpha-L-arabinosidase